MERITTKVIKEERQHVENYCDMCEVFIDSADEDGDGFIPTSEGEIGCQIHVFGKWYHINACLCPKCKEIFMKKIIDGISELGFEEDK